MSNDFVLGVILVVGAVLAVRTAVLAWRTRQFLARAARASGRITRFEQERRVTPGGYGESSETTTYHYPYVEFALEDGSLVTFRSRLGEETPTFRMDQIVTVVYELDCPETTAEIEGPASWQQVWLSGGLASLVFVAAGLGKACG